MTYRSNHHRQHCLHTPDVFGVVVGETSVEIGHGWMWSTSSLVAIYCWRWDWWHHYLEIREKGFDQICVLGTCGFSIDSKKQFSLVQPILDPFQTTAFVLLYLDRKAELWISLWRNSPCIATLVGIDATLFLWRRFFHLLRIAYDAKTSHDIGESEMEGTLVV